MARRGGVTTIGYICTPTVPIPGCRASPCRATGVTPRARKLSSISNSTPRDSISSPFSTLQSARSGGKTRAGAVEGGAKSCAAPVVVVATGWADFPYSPTWPDLETFRGAVAHSSAYRNPAPHAGKRVVVVGFGNSGGEIALDLAESKIDVTLAVRGPVRILPRELLGLPILTWVIAQRHLPARIADALNTPAIRLAVGSIESLGMKRAAKGPRQMVEEDGRIPLLDVGTVAKIRAGAIKVRGDIDRVTPDGVVFSETGPEAFDAIILATGFRPDLRALLPDATSVLDPAGKPLVSGKPTSAPGLFFCGAIASPTGQLREIGIEAQRIAKLAEAHLADRSPSTTSPRHQATLHLDR